MKTLKKLILGLAICLVASTASAGVSIPDASLDLMLAVISGTCDQLDITSDSSTPTNLTNSLGSVVLTVGAGNGDYVIGNGATSGRALTLTAQEITTSAAGTARHWVLSDGSGNIYLIGTITAKAMDTGQPYQCAEKVLITLPDAVAE